MKNLNYFFMGLAFLATLISMVANIINGVGFSIWCWQLTAMIWIMDSFFKEMRIQKLLKKLNDE